PAPEKLAARKRTAVDVAGAIRTQNTEAALGQVGQAPMSRTEAFQLPIDTVGRLREPAQFADIVVKARGSQPLSTSAGSGASAGGGGGLPSSGITDPLLAAASMSATTVQTKTGTSQPTTSSTTSTGTTSTSGTPTTGRVTS